MEMSGANLFADAHFYWLPCESNEHREEAERIRGERSCWEEQGAEDFAVTQISAPFVAIRSGVKYCCL